jgi:hypothetical protein
MENNVITGAIREPIKSLPSIEHNQYAHADRQGESVFRLRDFNILGFLHLFYCATCFGPRTIFKYTYFP